MRGWLPLVTLTTASKSSILGFVTRNGGANRKNSHRFRTRMSSRSAPLVDVDCNLWHKDLISLQTNQEETVPLSILNEDAIEESNIVGMLSPSSTLDEVRMGLNLLNSSPSTDSIARIPILTTVGVHPYHVNNDKGTSSLEQAVFDIKELINEPYVCAVGECGLDASDGFPPLNDQLPWFRAQVQLANECDKPLFVHERLAFTETMEILESCTVPVIIHCFTGTRAECKLYIQRGYSLSVSGFILREGSDEVKACLREGLIPLEKLMIETDAPYMGFSGCRQYYLAKHDEYVASLNSIRRKRLQNSMYPNVPSSLPIVLDEVVKLLNQGRMERE